MAAMPQVMAILNVTPDSFSDGGAHPDPVAAGLAMLARGADIVDIGGESTRPGADPVPPEEEQRRILPAIRALSREGARISVDTRHAATMRAALDAGAAIVNDVSALRHDPASAPLLARRTCPVILMHMRGTPQTMAGRAIYGDVVAEVTDELAARVAHAEAAGISRERITIDPGFGFAKTPAQNLALLAGLSGLATLGLPILAGVSRKGFIGAYGGQADPRRRGPASLAAALFALDQGASILRVHDVAATVQAVRMWQALATCGKGKAAAGAGRET
jgi:dihydropteroate synthase